MKRSWLAKEAACTRVEKEHREALERVAGMTADEAKKQLIQEMESQARLEAVGHAKRTLEEARENAEREAREIITCSIQRVVRDYVSESTISVVPIPNDAMKGRIIGREGRNIRAIEAATGIDLIIDETPEAVIVSGFDPLRREIAKVSLERLMHDGRIHPTRIEEIVEKVKVDIDKLMYEEAEKIIFELGLSDFHPELIKVLGRLKYRTSYGQNNLYHSREAAYICGIMASELGLDVKLARRGALLHDIGKAVSHEEEGPHAMLGAEIAKKYGESEKIVNAIAGHHEQVEPICPESVLVAAAEALSAARPGARREALETYVKRLEKLESLAMAIKGRTEGLCHSSGARNSRHRPTRGHHGCRVVPTVSRLGEEDRAGIDVSRHDQGHCYSRESVCGVCQVKVLFIGDIFGEPGRRAVARAVPKLVAQRPDRHCHR